MLKRKFKNEIIIWKNVFSSLSKCDGISKDYRLKKQEQNQLLEILTHAKFLKCVAID